MTDKSHPSPPDLTRPARDGIWAAAGFVEADHKRISETAAREYRGQNPKIKSKFIAAALAKAAKASDRRLARLLAEQRGTDALEVVVSNEYIAKPHWAYRVAGCFVGLSGIGLLTPLPLIIGAGVTDSLLIDKVLEEPLWALAYGFAPFGAVLASHGFRDALKSDAWKRRFDLTVYAGTLAAFGAYAVNFGPTFLVDVLTSPEAASEATSLARFYGYHLLLEVSGAASAYAASMHLLTLGAKRVSKRNEADVQLAEAIAEETQANLALAYQRDVVAVGQDTYTSAQSAYQDHAILTAEVAQKLLDAKSAGDNAQALAELRAAIAASQEGQTDV